MNKTPNPWHVSFSYARALQNTVLKTWQGNPANVAAAQKALIGRAKANSDACQGKFVPTEEDKKAIESTYQKNCALLPSLRRPLPARPARVSFLSDRLLTRFAVSLLLQTPTKCREFGVVFSAGAAVKAAVAWA